MARADPTDAKRGEEHEALTAVTAAEPGAAADEVEDEDYEPSFFEDPKRLAQTAALRRSCWSSGSTSCCRR